jgi:hypothetical protein
MRPSFFFLLGALACMAACADEEIPEGEEESEPVGSALTSNGSAVDCHVSRMPAYDHGKAFQIDVIKIGGKRVSMPTGHAFLKMQAAAKKAGVGLSISSGFRTMDEQQHFYDCYIHKSCNNGNLAAKPGYSNHQNGRALDLTTSSWLASNAGKFGFKRTVPSEAWHYEYSGDDPGGACSGSASKGSSTSPLKDTSQEKPQPSPVPDTTDPSSDAPTDGGCFSATLQTNVKELACVRAAESGIWFQCNQGEWYRGGDDASGPFGECACVPQNGIACQ